MIPSLVKLSAKRPRPTPEPSYRTIIIKEPIAQEVARLLFRMAPVSDLSGYFGQVRRLNLVRLESARLRIRMDRADATFAIKRSDVTTEGRMGVVYNEYLTHRSVYACIQAAYPSATAYFAYPFEMRIPCHHIRPESRSSGASISPITPLSVPPVTIELPEESDDMDEESLVTSCETAHGFVFTVQSWGCVVGEKTSSLDKMYTQLTNDQLRDVGTDVGTALRCLHACKYRHNDLSFRNIIVCQFNTKIRAVILDFGIATHESEIDDDSFWSEVSQCIAEIYKIDTGHDFAWRKWSSFQGSSIMIDAAYEAWSNGSK